MELPKPEQQHQWLHKLVGEWTYESECHGEPGQPPVYAGTDFVVVRDGRIAAIYLFFDGEPDPTGSTVEA